MNGNKKNTPKGVYVGKCPKCRHENKCEITPFSIGGEVPQYCSKCGTKTSYRKNLVV